MIEDEKYKNNNIFLKEFISQKTPPFDFTDEDNYEKEEKGCEEKNIIKFNSHNQDFINFIFSRKSIISICNIFEKDQLYHNEVKKKRPFKDKPAYFDILRKIIIMLYINKNN